MEIGNDINQQIKTICLVLITLTIMVSAGFYVWDTIEKQSYFEKQEQEQWLEKYKAKIQVGEKILFPDE